MMRRLLIATHNPGKLAEFAQLLAPSGWSAVSAKDLGLPEPAETGTSFAENAALKAHAAASTASLPALADDSGFCAAALDGGPDIFSARYAAGDYPAACARIIAAAQTRGDWQARFVCALCLVQPDGTATPFTGVAHGHIAPAPRGCAGFGYDPIFIPDGYGQTYAELGTGVKSRIGHRALAFAQLREWLEDN